MNFFSKSKNASDATTATTDSSATGLTPAPAPPLPAQPTDATTTTTAPLPATDPDPTLPLAPPSEASIEEPSKKSRFARFKPQLPKKPQFPNFRSAGTRKAATENDVIDLTDQLDEVQIASPPVDPAKAARRAARRAERTRLEEEWAEKERRLRNDALLTGLPMEELKPLPHFDSASEDEREPPAVTDAPIEHSHHDAVLGEGVNATFRPQGPHMPTNPNTYPVDPMDQPDPPQVFHGQQQPIIPPHQPQHHQQQPARDPSADAHMAEMLGARAYTGSMGYQAPPHAAPVPQAMGTYDAVPYPQTYAPPQHQHSQQGMRGAPANPTPIGWGDVYSVPSQPMFAAPMHGSRGMLDIDPVLAERIRRGRELARLAVEQEEQGNLGAAENGYMKALELLVPVAKELDVGSDLDKSVRMKQKAKIQREASHMLDRCEEIQLFLKANGPAVPMEMPSVPSVPGKRSSPGKKKAGGTAKPPDQDADISISGPKRTSTTELSIPKPVEPEKGPGGPPTRPPPPPPPTFDGDSGDLLERIVSRRNVLSAATAGIHAASTAPATVPTAVPARAVEDKKATSGGSVASCFVCNAPAELKAKCEHAFCNKCGNQAANVFGACPDRSCNAPLSSGGFEKIQ